MQLLKAGLEEVGLTKRLISNQIGTSDRNYQLYIKHTQNTTRSYGYPYSNTVLLFCCIAT